MRSEDDAESEHLARMFTDDNGGRPERTESLAVPVREVDQLTVQIEGIGLARVEDVPLLELQLIEKELPMLKQEIVAGPGIGGRERDDRAHLFRLQEGAESLDFIDGAASEYGGDRKSVV